MRSIIFLAAFCVLVTPFVSSQQSAKATADTTRTVAEQNAANATGVSSSADQVVFSGQTTLLRVMDPSEEVAINGRVVRVADLLPLLSLDSASAPHPRIPASHSRETSQPVHPAAPEDQHSH
jgi:hypothetical protein